MTPRRPAALTGAVLAGALTLAAQGCSSGAPERELTVLAAASLTEPFGELADVLEREQPDLEVRLSFASSATVAQQAVEGAPADLLATADTRTMASAAAVHAEEPVTFAHNTMVLVTDPDGEVRTVADLDRADYVLCVPTAPCGAIAQRLLDDAGISRPPASQEVDVRAVLARVVQGEAAAGVVYASDALSAGSRVRRVALPGAEQDPTAYQVVRLAGADEALAQPFLDLLLSPTGRRILSEAGFR